VLVRLVTVVDVREDDTNARRMSLWARHEAVLADGRRLVLLDDRGWSEELRGAGEIWAHATAEDLARTARVVVGADEPFGGRTRAEMVASHWETLAGTLRRHGVEVGAAELAALPHDVELGDGVLARLRRS